MDSHAIMAAEIVNLKAHLAAASSERDSLAEQLRVAREALEREKMQSKLIALGRDWWILQASRAMNAKQFKALRDTPLDERTAALTPPSAPAGEKGASNV